MGGLEVLDPRYLAVHDRAMKVFGADERVIATAVGGSVATGTADAWSDLDLQVAVRAGDYEGFLADWEAWLADITATVFARRPITPFIVNSLTPDGLTLDISVYADALPPPFVAPTQYTAGMLSFNRYDTAVEAMQYAVEEQLRGLAGPFVTLIQREEHVRHFTGVPHIVGGLTAVFLAETGAAPPGKRMNESLTDDQLAAVAALPPVSATRDGLIAFGLAVAELVVTRARPIFDHHSLAWPTELAHTAAARLQSQLGIDAPWLR
ncbi:MAG: hypothetical protein ACR2H3_11775 [Acidimicrobiales bacterium]